MENNQRFTEVGSVVEINMPSTLKIKFDCGVDGEGKPVMKSRSFSNVKAASAAVDVYNVAVILASLQKHTLFDVVKQDNTNLAE